MTTRGRARAWTRACLLVAVSAAPGSDTGSAPSAPTPAGRTPLVERHRCLRRRCRTRSRSPWARRWRSPFRRRRRTRLGLDHARKEEMSRMRILSLVSVVAALVLFAVPARAQDSDGCSEGPPPELVQIETSWSQNGREFRARYTNNSNTRIYVRACSQYESRPEERGDCGANSIRPGRTWSWTTYGGATGETEIAWVGSENPGMDWVCSSRARLVEWQPSWYRRR